LSVAVSLAVAVWDFFGVWDLELGISILLEFGAWVLGFRFDPSRHQPEHVRKTIYVNNDLGIVQLIRFLQRADATFGAATGRARNINHSGVQRRAGCGPAFEGNILGLDVTNERVEL
jgi:hypothetical protein